MTSTTPTTPPANLAPAHGSIVTYYLPDGNGKGQPRVALVAYAHGSTADSVLDLWVFANPRSDGLKYASALFVPGVQNGKLPGQWS
jgi:hypothetical protein